MTNVTSAARPSSRSATKRASMRVAFMAHTAHTPLWMVSSRAAPQMPCDRIEVLVAAAGQVDHHQVIAGLLWREIKHLGDSVRRFQRRDDAFQLGEKLEGVERLIVGRRKKRDAAYIVEPRVLGPNARIIEAGGYRVRFVDLPVLVHEKIGAVAVQDAGPSAGDRRRMFTAFEPMTGRLDAVNFYAALIEKRMEQTHGVRAAADAGDE